MTIEMANIVDHQISQKEDEDQYLTFTLGEELYGVDILRVQEIKGYSKLTRIPNTPAFIKGLPTFGVFPQTQGGGVESGRLPLLPPSFLPS